MNLVLIQGCRFGEAALRHGDLIEVEWRILRVLLPVERKPEKRGCGRPPADNRNIINSSYGGFAPVRRLGTGQSAASRVRGPREGEGAHEREDVCASSSSSVPGTHRFSSIARKNLVAASEQNHLCRIHDIRRATERLGQGRSSGALGCAVCPPSPSTR